MMIFLFVAVGAAVGAPARYLVDRAVQARHDSVFPWGTFTVNVTGTFLLGLLIAVSAHLPAQVAALVGTGFCGALTTYSTFTYETLRLQEDRARFYAAANVIASIIAGAGAATLGTSLGLALIG